jgi:TP901 family phage tail tape measure protein
MADVGEIRARLVLSSDDFNRGMQQARNQMEQTGRSAERTREAFDKIQKASLGFVAAVGGVFAASIGTAANFEQKMKDVQAVSGESADNMKKLTDLAIDMGNKTAFSASEAADGIQELVKAGVSVTDILNGGLEGALNLAIAGELNLGEAAQIASTALNAFKKDGLSVAQAADILAGAANASATDVREMQQGLSMVATVAAGAGLTFKDTSTALAAFAQNGLRGSDAGTSLKTMLLNLIPQTKTQAKLFDQLGVTVKGGSNAFFDAHGNIKSMAEIAQVLHDKLKNLTNEQRQSTLQMMFGTDAIRAANILYEEGAKGINDMWSAMSKVTAADVAKTKMETLKGAFDNFQSSLETVGIKIGNQFLPVLTQIVRGATDLIGSFDDVKLVNLESAAAFAGTAAAVALVGSTIMKLISTVRLMYASMGPAGWVILGLSLLAGVIAQNVTQTNLMDDAILKNLKTRTDEANSIKSMTDEYDALRMKAHLTTEEFGRYVDIQNALKTATDPNVIANLSKQQDDLRKKSGLSNQELDKMVQLNGDLIKKVPEATKKITDQGQAILGNTDSIKKYNQAKLDELYHELDLQKIKTETQYRDLLKQESDIIQKRKTDEEKLDTLRNKRDDAQQKANDAQSKLNEMMANSTKYSQAALQAQIEKNAAAQTALETLQKQLETQAGVVQQDGTDLENTQKKLRKLQDIRDEMANIVLAQVGLNSKQGEELQTIDTAIDKLQSQKATLENTTPAAQRNTQEYRDAVSAINAQIGKLETAKSKVEEITGKAEEMNAALREEIHKNIVENHIQRVIQAGHQLIGGPQDSYHTGGIVGRRQMPQLHVGGLASQFANAPNHNEIDVRLLRNEMVLTEAQQANLMRIIDAGMTGNARASADNSEVVALLRSLNRKMDKGFNSTIVMDSREVGFAVEPHVTEAQSFNQSRKGRF